MNDIETIDPERLLLPSASAFERVVLCPGSVRLCATLKSTQSEEQNASEGQPDGKDDELAASGTRIHEAFETGNTLNLDSDEAAIYRQGIEHEKAIVEKWMADKNLDDCEEGPRELRVWLHDPLNFPELLGSVRLDRHYYNRARGCVLSVDWKTGFNPNLPPSPRSWQLRFGVVALWREEYDWMKEARVAHCKAQSTCATNDYCDYNESDLGHSWDSIQFHLWESAQPDAQLRPGAHCRWCPAKAHCPQAASFALLPSVMAKSVTRSPEMSWELMVSTMTPQDLVKVWENSNVITKILDAVKTRLKAMPKDDLALLGLELGKGRKLDPIANIPETFQFLSQHFAVEDILKCMSVKKGDLAALVMKDQGCSKEAAGLWINEKLDAWIARCESEAPLRKMKT